jgi:hypothetical protein
MPSYTVEVREYGERTITYRVDADDEQEALNKQAEGEAELISNDDFWVTKVDMVDIRRL